MSEASPAVDAPDNQAQGPMSEDMIDLLLKEATGCLEEVADSGTEKTQVSESAAKEEPPASADPPDDRTSPDVSVDAEGKFDEKAFEEAYDRAQAAQSGEPVETPEPVDEAKETQENSDELTSDEPLSLEPEAEISGEVVAGDLGEPSGSEPEDVSNEVEGADKALMDATEEAELPDAVESEVATQPLSKARFLGRLCGKIALYGLAGILVIFDKPFAGLSMGTKNMLGYAGAATLVVAGATWLLGGFWAAP